MERELPTGSALVRRILVHTAGYAMLAISVVSLYLWGLVRLTPEQWARFFATVGAAFFVIFPAMVLVHRRIFGHIQDCLNRRAAGELGRAELERGFAAVCDFPRYWFVWGMVWWGGGSTGVCLAMRIQDPQFGLLPAATIVGATLSIAVVMDMYYFFTIKSLLAPIRDALAADIGDIDVRRRLIRPVPLRTKLLVAIVSVIGVTVLFAGSLAQSRAQESVERFVLRRQARILDVVVRRGADSLDRFSQALAELDNPMRLSVLPASGVGSIDEASVALSDTLLEQARAAAPSSDRGSVCDATGCRSYRRLDDGAGLVVAFTEAEQMSAGSGVGPIFAGLLLFSMLVSIGAAYLLARDVGVATETLKHEAARVASGDLASVVIFDSEDELGELAHAFERMGASLRSTLVRVANGAERVQAAAADVGSAASRVRSATEGQIRGMAVADGAMRKLDGQVAEIAEAVTELDGDVVSASSSLLQLDTSSGELSRNASSVSASVDEVGSSVEEMARAIAQVEEGSRDVAEVADATSTGMSQAAVGMKKVRSKADEMSELSARIVELSGVGHRSVQRTIEGIEAIAADSEAAREVIGALSMSASEIETVIEVIESVADESSLLALNAAIIAAQSGDEGRAFAVVASQIRDLARRVSAHVQDVRDLVDTVQEQSAQVESAIARGGESVQRGLERSREAGTSLEEIARVTRESVPCISEIMRTVEEQSLEVERVVERMTRLRAGSSQISQSIGEQGRSTEFVRESAGQIGDVAKRLSHSTEEQALATSGIRTNMESIRHAVAQISSALRDQAGSCRDVVAFLGELEGSTESNGQSVEQLELAAAAQQRVADVLQEEIARFRL